MISTHVFDKFSYFLCFHSFLPIFFTRNFVISHDFFKYIFNTFFMNFDKFSVLLSIFIDFVQCSTISSNLFLQLLGKFLCSIIFRFFFYKGFVILPNFYNFFRLIFNSFFSFFQRISPFYIFLAFFHNFWSLCAVLSTFLLIFHSVFNNFSRLVHYTFLLNFYILRYFS